MKAISQLETTEDLTRPGLSNTNKQPIYQTTTLINEPKEDGKIVNRPLLLETCYSESPFISITASSPDHNEDHFLYFENGETKNADSEGHSSPFKSFHPFFETGRRHSSCEILDDFKEERHRSSSMPRLHESFNQVCIFHCCFASKRSNYVLNILFQTIICIIAGVKIPKFFSGKFWR